MLCKRKLVVVAEPTMRDSIGQNFLLEGVVEEPLVA
jgi:hypothetical protein